MTIKTTSKPHRAQQQTAELKPHLLAERICEMDKAQFDSLKLSIKTMGRLTDPIDLFDGMILDGRHRYKACIELGIAPTFRQFKGSYAEAVEYVIAKNAHRHMSEAQRVCAAEAFMDDLVKHRRPGPKDERQNALGSGKSSEIAALRFGVKARQVERVRAIRQVNTVIYEKILAGRANVNQAATQLKHSAREKEVRSLRRSAAVTLADCELLCGDNVEVMGKMKPASARVIFADPPYNNGWAYDADPDRDRVHAEVYLKRLRATVEACARLLADDGSLFLLIDDAWSDPVGMMLRSTGLVRRPTIVWVETFGTYNATEDGLSRGCRFVHYYTRSNKPLVNTVESRVESWRRANGDPRANEHGRMPDNIWQIARITSQSHERVPWLGQAKQPPQLPLELVRRCILLASNPGDLVLDPFNGNGVTGVAALTEQRRYVGIDRSQKYIDQARRWIASEYSRLTQETRK